MFLSPLLRNAYGIFNTYAKFDTLEKMQVRHLFGNPFRIIFPALCNMLDNVLRVKGSASDPDQALRSKRIGTSLAEILG